MKNEILILTASDILSVLRGHDEEAISTVKASYAAHAEGFSSLPHSTFLFLAQGSADRIIALPAFLGKEFQIAGVKWISSFPANYAQGKDRASAIIVLNSVQDGRPVAILEGAIISAKRTAASAVLAIQCLFTGEKSTCIGLVGCGVINWEILRLILTTAVVCPSRILLYDIIPARATCFQLKIKSLSPNCEVAILPNIDAILEGARIVSFATTATTPHVFSLSACKGGSLLLHISLRDLAPELMFAVHNVVDDLEHVCRAHTSVHLAEGISGSREFVHGELHDYFDRKLTAANGHEVTVFSPFGLGVLDIGLASMIYSRALQLGLGRVVPDFFPKQFGEMPIVDICSGSPGEHDG